MGRCVQALLINEAVADVKPSTSSNAQICDNRYLLVAWYSAILDANKDDVKLFLDCPGTAELATMATLVSCGVGSSDANALPSEVRDVAQQTLAMLSRTANLHLDQPIAQLDISDVSIHRIIVSGLRNILQKCILSPSTLRTEVRRGCLRISLKCLWYCAKAYQIHDESEPSSAYFFSTLGVARPEFIQLCQTEQDRDSRVMGRCMGTLAVTKLMIYVRSRSDSGVQIGNDELAFLSIILGTGSDDIESCLEWPDAVEIAAITSLALGDFCSLGGYAFHQEVRMVAKETIAIISRALSVENTVGLRPFCWDDICNGKLARMVVSCLHNLLQVHISGASALTANVRRSCLRMCLRSLWYCAEAYHQPDISEPLPSYFPSNLASPEIIRLIHVEQDPVSRATGRCFGALVVMKMAADIRSRADLNLPIRDEELACLSAILDAEDPNLRTWFSRPCAIELANMISLISTEIDFLFSDTVSSESEVLDMMQQTYNILTRTLPAELSAKLTNFTTEGQCGVHFSYRLFSLNLLIRVVRVVQIAYQINKRQAVAHVFGEPVALCESIRPASNRRTLTVLLPHHSRQPRVHSTHSRRKGHHYSYDWTLPSRADRKQVTGRLSVRHSSRKLRHSTGLTVSGWHQLGAR